MSAIVGARDDLEPAGRSVARRLRDIQPPSGWPHPAHLVTACLVVMAGWARMGPPNDPDLFWHLRTGEWILDAGRLPGTDPWAYDGEAHRWITHEWLAEVFFALAHRAGGMAGVAVFTTLLTVALLAAIAVVAARRTTPWRTTAITVVAAVAVSGGLGERPQLVSFVLLAPAAVYVRSMTRGTATGWWLVPLVYMWANLHGLWFLVVALLGVTALGALMDSRWTAWRRFGRHTAIGVAAVAAAAFTPNGPGLLLSPLHVREYAPYVAEWSVPSIQDDFVFAFAVLLALIVVKLARSREIAAWSVLLETAFIAVLGLTYIRTVAPAAVLAATLLAEIWGRPDRVTSGRPGLARAEARPAATQAGNAPAAGRWPGALLVALAATALVVVAIVAAPPRDAVGEKWPVRATEALLRQPGPLTVLNEYSAGGYLLWAAPEVRASIDGRTELYPVEYVAGYRDALETRPGWQDYVAEVDAQYALFRDGAPIVDGLRGAGWTTVYEDDWVLLRRP